MNAGLTEVLTTPRAFPSIELSRFISGSHDDQKRFCTEFVGALKTFGFVSLTRHGIDDVTVEEAIDWNRRFHALPVDIKLKAAHPKVAIPHRGYCYVGQEVVSNLTEQSTRHRHGSTVVDIKETFDQGLEDDQLCLNRWVDESDLPGFRSFMEAFFHICHAVHIVLLRCIEIGLELKPDTFVSRCSANTSELRLTHYPACDAETIRSGKANRISEHTDFGTLTLLFQDNVGGLEIEDQTHHGTYLPIVERRGEVIVNIGDCMQRWTNNVLVSTKHRVRLPVDYAEPRLGDRYSIAYFAKPGRDENVATLDEFISPSFPAKYGAMTAWNYFQARLNMLFV
ncbi:Clavaminate synthase-like protein [Mollisia scopiformis]|uniref:Clavaminate synthase-like protein n=1 Tax=Mollisia scopiformis TaxID=149040 RepID=A0A194XIH7_MOLSC|nr:Clavaminate synthase-like protein [Mollisia scopiformis]KUJ19572.1 Clavaminate synthase-like protein [Mollisia scopiformis]